jgi:hypothetical protein
MRVHGCSSSVLAYHLGVTAVRIITNAANCQVDTSQSEVVRKICETVGTDCASNLPAILVSEGGCEEGYFAESFVNTCLIIVLLSLT